MDWKIYIDFWYQKLAALCVPFTRNLKQFGHKMERKGMLQQKESLPFVEGILSAAKIGKGVWCILQPNAIDFLHLS